MDREPVEDLAKDHALDVLEAGFRLFDEANPACRLRYPPVPVVAEALVPDRLLELASVAEPSEVPSRKAEHLTQIGHVVEPGDWPACLAHRRRCDEPSEDPWLRLAAPVRRRKGLGERRAVGEKRSQLAWPVARS